MENNGSGVNSGTGVAAAALATDAGVTVAAPAVAPLAPGELAAAVANVAKRSQPVASTATVPHTLSNGTRATTRRASGQDMLDAAQLAVPLGGGGMAVTMAITALCSTVDGAPVQVEDFLTWPAEDVSLLIDAVTGNG